MECKYIIPVASHETFPRNFAMLQHLSGIGDRILGKASPYGTIRGARLNLSLGRLYP